MSTEAAMTISRKDVYAACLTEDIPLLQAWRDAGQLPDLMTKEAYEFFPQPLHALVTKHGKLRSLQWIVEESGQRIDLTSDGNLTAKLAAYEAQLPALSWLVHKSGQFIDITADDNEILRLAVAQGHLSVLKWLVTESGQQVDLSRDRNILICLALSSYQLKTLDWLIRESNQLSRILAATSTAWSDKLPEQLRQCVQRAQVVHNFLNHQQVPVDGQQSYLLSVACYSAVSSGLVTTVEELENILRKAAKARMVRSKL